MRKYRVIFKGGKEYPIFARGPCEAIRKLKLLLPKYEIVGYYEV